MEQVLTPNTEQLNFNSEFKNEQIYQHFQSGEEFAADVVVAVVVVVIVVAAVLFLFLLLLPS